MTFGGILLILIVCCDLSLGIAVGVIIEPEPSN
jgi:hypothetical protein